MDWYKKAATYIVDGSGSDSSSSRTQSKHHQQQQQQLGKSFVSGFLAGGTAITILYPIGLMRTKLALDMGQTQRLYPNGMRDVIRHTIRVNGISGLYKGYGVAFIGWYIWVVMIMERHNC